MVGVRRGSPWHAHHGMEGREGGREGVSRRDSVRWCACARSLAATLVAPATAQNIQSAKSSQGVSITPAYTRGPQSRSAVFLFSFFLFFHCEKKRNERIVCVFADTRIATNKHFSFFFFFFKLLFYPRDNVFYFIVYLSTARGEEFFQNHSSKVDPTKRSISASEAICCDRVCRAVFINSH